MVSLALVSWETYAQHDHGGSSNHGQEKEMSTSTISFKDKGLGEVYSNYIHLKNALVASDAMMAMNASTDLYMSLQGMKNVDEVFKVAKVAANAVSLTDQLKAFVPLSAEMMALLKNSKLTKGEVFVAFCPMANESSGAYWLSNEASIANPYFGETMRSCGSIKETIN